MIDYLLPVSAPSYFLSVWQSCLQCFRTCISLPLCSPTSCLVPFRLCASNSSTVNQHLHSLLAPAYHFSSVLSLFPTFPEFELDSFELSVLFSPHHTVPPPPNLAGTLPSDPLQSQYDSWLSLVDHLNIKAFVNLTLADSVRHGIQHLLFISGLGQCHHHYIRTCQ